MLASFCHDPEQSDQSCEPPKAQQNADGHWKGVRLPRSPTRRPPSCGRFQFPTASAAPSKRLDRGVWRERAGRDPRLIGVSSDRHGCVDGAKRQNARRQGHTGSQHGGCSVASGTGWRPPCRRDCPRPAQQADHPHGRFTASVIARYRSVAANPIVWYMMKAEVLSARNSTCIDAMPATLADSKSHVSIRRAMPRRRCVGRTASSTRCARSSPKLMIAKPTIRAPSRVTSATLSGSRISSAIRSAR